MKALFLTSNLGSYIKKVKGNEVVKEIVKCNNSNHFIDSLKNCSKKLSSFVCIASNPDSTNRTDEYATNVVKSLNLDNFEIKSVAIIDHRFVGDIKQTVLNADCIFLMGGNVPTQNKYFKEIGLKEILDNYSGIVIGQSAGSMNCSKIVYTQPEEDEEFEDENYQRKLAGLGLVDFTIMPHMNSANEVDDKGHKSVMQMCLEDSHKIPHLGIYDYGFIEVQGDDATAYGKTLLIKDGEIIELCGDKETFKLSSQLLNIWNNKNAKQ